MEKTTLDQWIDQVLPLHDRLTKVSVNLIEKLIQERGIDYVSVTGRTKDKISGLEKIDRKSYSKPLEQLTDLSGVRVIVFFESQITLVSDLIREAFIVDNDNSMGRDSVLGEDRIGYRSVHFVCSLGDNRKSLPEYASITDLKVEFQIRTVLQHAWAELAHDGSYKFSGELPAKLQRQLNLYSGMLEVVDLGFDEIATAIDIYKQEINETGLSELGDREIDSINIEKFLIQTIRENDLKVSLKGVERAIVDELKTFGVHTLSDLYELITVDFIKNYKSAFTHNTSIGILRDIMMYADIDRYFVRCMDDAGWIGIENETIKFLESKYGKDKIREIINKYDLIF